MALATVAAPTARYIFSLFDNAVNPLKLLTNVYHRAITGALALAITAPVVTITPTRTLTHSF